MAKLNISRRKGKYSASHFTEWTKEEIYCCNKYSFAYVTVNSVNRNDSITAQSVDFICILKLCAKKHNFKSGLFEDFHGENEHFDERMSKIG